MIARTASDWLQAWEVSCGLNAARRPLELLRAATGARSAEDFADIPLGRRDALLLDLRAALFGSQVPCRVDCGNCKTRLELDIELEHMRAAPASSDLAVEHDGFELRFRLPTTRDQSSISGCHSVQEARRRLLEACLSDVSHRGQPTPIADLPEPVVERVIAQMQAADPQAAPTLELHCPACGARWEADFDVARFLWAELDNWATHVMLDVHDLARAYGWSEQTILALSPARRRCYVGMLAA
jgi:hypothetical protein